MHIMLKTYLIISLIIFSNCALYSQIETDSTITFADRQLITGNYSLAAKEYQRTIFFSEKVQPDILLKLAESFYNQGNWQQARDYYNQVIHIAENNNQIIEAKFNVISSYISENNYNKALIELFNIHDSTYIVYKYEVDILFGICYFGLQDFKESKSYFLKTIENDTIAKAKIDSIFSEKKLLYRPSPKIASILSIILPGLGQVYSGNFYEAANSFFLTESILVLAMIVTYQYTFIDAVFTVIPWYQRYYLGGVENAEKIAKQKQDENRNKAYKAILDIIANSQNSLE